MMSDTSLKITINLAKKCLDLEIHSDWKVSCDREQEVGGLSIVHLQPRHFASDRKIVEVILPTQP